jgi:hypothetical protein
MSRFTLVVFSNPVEGREDEYNDWYNNQHLGDVVGVPGFRSAQRFRTFSKMVGEFSHKYLALYEMEADSPEAAAAANTALTSTEMYVSPALDAAGVQVGIFEAEAPQQTAGGRAGAYRLLASVDAVQGREAEYADWYQKTHIPEVLAAPGFVSGQRLKLHTTVAGEFTNGYLSIFEIAAETPEALGQTLKGMGGSNMSKTDAARGATTVAGILEVCSAKVDSPRVKTLA